MTGDLPQMSASAYSTQAFNLANFALANQYAGVGAGNLANVRAVNFVNTQPVTEEKAMTNPTRRLVQVFICDPNDNVPTESCLLYRGEQKLTDATDQELFFEIDLKTILDKHNEKRVTFVDKKVKERTEHLEPARVRDLKMVVTTVAQF